MDIETLYFTHLSTTFAWLTVPLYFLCIVTFFCPPPEMSETFPPPPGKASKVVKVPLYPRCHEIFFLLLALLAEMVLLYPYVPDGTTNPLFSQYWGYPLFAYHGCKAICWSGMQRNWIAAEQMQGLWHLKGWAVYYLVHILMGIAVGLPLLFRLGFYFAVAFYHVGVTSYYALLTAYGPLN